MATIIKVARKSGVRYKAQVRLSGLPTQCRSFTSRKDAVAWARQVEGDERRLRALGRTAASRTTVSQAIDAYLADYTGRDPTRRQRLSFWRQRLGQQLLTDLTRAEVRAGLETLSCAGPTRNRYLSALSAVLHHAQGLYDLPSNPCRGIPLARENDGRDRVLSDEEQARLLDACTRSSWPKLRLLVLMALTTGARRGELLNLTWQDIDWQRRAVTFARTKAGGSRTVPVPEQVLVELRGLARPLDGSRLVFESSLLPGQPFHVKRAWQQARAAAGLGGFTFHGLRHTAVTRLLAAGHGDLLVAKLVGHRSLQTTKRYAHPDVDDLRVLSETLSGLCRSVT